MYPRKHLYYFMAELYKLYYTLVESKETRQLTDAGRNQYTRNLKFSTMRKIIYYIYVLLKCV